MQLAVLFGYPSVRKLQEEITAAEFVEWIAYDNVVGLPDPWLQSARLAHCMSGVKVEDFIPRKKPTLSDDQIWSQFKRQRNHGRNR